MRSTRTTRGNVRRVRIDRATDAKRRRHAERRRDLATAAAEVRTRPASRGVAPDAAEDLLERIALVLDR